VPGSESLPANDPFPGSHFLDTLVFLFEVLHHFVDLRHRNPDRVRHLGRAEHAAAAVDFRGERVLETPVL
jgi:hypothetical protein